MADEKKIFSENLKRYMESKGKTQTDLIDDLNINKSTISTWVNGLKMPRMGTIQTLANYFGILKSDLIEDKSEIRKRDDVFSIPGILPIEIQKLPLLGEISCGELRFADEDFQGHVECGADIRADFALRARGDSMINARIYDGDIVFIRQQPIVESGELAAVLVEDEVSLKRFYRYDGVIVLHPENHAFDDIVVRVGEDVNIRILGKAVAVRSDLA